MKCQNCGNEIDDKALFCTYCGSKVAKEEVKQSEVEESVEKDSTDEVVNSEEEIATSAEILDEVEPNTEKASAEDSESTNEPVKNSKAINIKLIAIIASIAVVLIAGGIFGYNKYMNTVLSSKAYNRDYSIVSNETLAFNYVKNINNGELYVVKDGKATKIADNVKPDIYHLNPVKDFVIYQTNEGTGGKNYIYKDGKSTDFDGEFYKYTEDGQYMLYINDSKLIAYNCDTGETKKIANAEGDKNSWQFSYDGKNKIIYVTVGEKNKLYKANMNDESEAESVVSNVEKFSIFGLNAYGFSKGNGNKYQIMTQNAQDTIALDFTDINSIQASVDGETIIFTGTKDEDSDIIFNEKEYALYAMVEGNEEPIKLLSGPVDNFVYKEDINKIYAYKENSVYSVDLPVKTRKNTKDKELYYNALSQCEAQKVVSDVSRFDISPDGNSIIVVGNNKTTEKSEQQTEAATKNNNGEPSGAFLSVVYADEKTVAEKKETATEVQTKNVTKSEATTKEPATETTTVERKVGETCELTIIRGDKKKTVDISSSVDLQNQYLRISNNSVVYPLAVNGKVELHIIKNINKSFDNIDKNDEVLTTDAGLFKFDQVKDEFILFDKDKKDFTYYSNGKKTETPTDYDLVYVNSGYGFDGRILAYKKTPEYSSFVGKYKFKTDNSVLKSLIVEFTSNQEMKVYAIGAEQATCKIKLDAESSNKTALRISPADGIVFSAACNPYYDHSNYTYKLMDYNLMSSNSLLIADFDNSFKYKLNDDTNLVMEKLSDEDFKKALNSQKATHNNNVAKLNQEKAAAEAAAAEAARKESLRSLALDYYMNGVYVYSSDTLYSWHSRAYSTTTYYINSKSHYVYDYYIDYDNGDIWLLTISSEGKNLWVVR